MGPTEGEEKRPKMAKSVLQRQSQILLYTVLSSVLTKNWYDIEVLMGKLLIPKQFSYIGPSTKRSLGALIFTSFFCACVRACVRPSFPREISGTVGQIFIP